MPGIRERVGNVVLGRRGEDGKREGGIGALFRGGNGQTMLNPVSAIGDRIGRNVAGRVNDWRTDRLENRHRQELIAAEGRGTPVMAQRPSTQSPSMPGRVPMPDLGRRAVETGGSNGPTVNGRPMTQAEMDRYAADPRSILNRNAGQVDPLAPVDRGSLSNYRDLSAPTRAGGGMNAARDRAMQAIAARGINANRID